jgi:hypothetical protein
MKPEHRTYFIQPDLAYWSLVDTLCESRSFIGFAPSSALAHGTLSISNTTIPSDNFRTRDPSA